MGDPTHEPPATVTGTQNAGGATGSGNTGSTGQASTSRAALQSELRQLDFEGGTARVAVVQKRPAAGAQTKADRLPFHQMKSTQDDAALEDELAAAGAPPRTPITRAFYEEVRAKYLADDPRRHQLAGQGLSMNGDFPTPTFTFRVVQWQETRGLPPTGFIEDSQLRALAKAKETEAPKLPIEVEKFLGKATVRSTRGADAAIPADADRRPDDLAAVARVLVRRTASRTPTNVRNPLLGVMDLKKELVQALVGVAGLHWGATDFGAVSSGDMMHFDLGYAPKNNEEKVEEFKS